MVLTTEQMHFIDNEFLLAGYPKSHFFIVGFELQLAGHIDAALDAFKRGADNVGCVPCMCFYIDIQWKRGNLYLLLPYAFEGAIRGNMPCMNYLVDCYNNSEPAIANALSSFCVKLRIEMGALSGTTEEERKKIKKNFASVCYVCQKEDSKDKVFEKCGICKYYSYCGKKCQTRHWKEGKHNCECRQLIILRKYCKPSYVKEIREAIIGGQDPKEIHTLQRLRMKLGLNRPKEAYEELVVSLGDDDTNDTNNSPNRYEYLVGRNDGTVHIGSTPNVI